MSDYHKSVLLQETILGLNVKKRHKYIDGTLGGGGHTKEILSQGGIVLGIDLDDEAIEHVEKELNSPDLVLRKGNFRNIDEIAKQNGFEKVSGILLDLGVSSHQIDDETRGFSYQKDADLDMRMDKSANIKAADLLNVLTKGELYEIFRKYGEEMRSGAISNNIIESRRVKAFKTTKDLTDVVEKSYGLRGEVNMKLKAKVNSRIFQALRIAVNDELRSLEEFLPKAVDLLLPEGRLCVISFHSLEDRAVKQSFISFEQRGMGRIITKKPIIPSLDEILSNRRSKSAKLRIFEHI